jgi:hypothetical protein
MDQPVLGFFLLLYHVYLAPPTRTLSLSLIPIQKYCIFRGNFTFSSMETMETRSEPSDNWYFAKGSIEQLFTFSRLLLDLARQWKPPFRYGSAAELNTSTHQMHDASPLPRPRPLMQWLSLVKVYNVWTSHTVVVTVHCDCVSVCEVMSIECVQNVM